LKYASDSEFGNIKKNIAQSVAERISSANTASSVGPILRKNRLATGDKSMTCEIDQSIVKVTKPMPTKPFKF